MLTISKSLDETKEVAQKFLNSLEKGDGATVVLLQGDLGAGKTAFSQAVGEILGVVETMQSPTFVIEKIYEIYFKGFKRLIHIDAYRIEKESELIHLGWQEIINDPENLILLEWPEKVPGILPETAKKINFKFVDETTREIEIKNLEN